MLEFTAKADPDTLYVFAEEKAEVLLGGTLELDASGRIRRETVSFQYDRGGILCEEESEIVFEEPAALPDPLEPAGTAFLLPDLCFAEMADATRLAPESGKFFVKRSLDADIAALGTVIRQNELLFVDRRSEPFYMQHEAAETVKTPQETAALVTQSLLEDGVLTVIEGEEKTSFKADGEALIAAMLEGLMINRPLLGSFEPDSAEDDDLFRLLRWNGNEALGEEIGTGLCEALLGNAGILAERAEEYRTEALTMTLTVNMFSYRPVSLKLEYTGVYLIDGQEYRFTAVTEERYLCGVTAEWTSAVNEP